MREQAERTVTLGPYVDGRSITSESQATVDVIDPSNGKVRLKIPQGTDVDVDRGVLAARRAFDDGRWCDTSPSFRKAALECWADLIARESAWLDEMDAGEMGKPIAERLANGAAAAHLVRFYAEAIDKAGGHLFGSDKNSLVTQRRVPRGTVAAIVPWNFPTFVFALKAAPALAAGNSVIVKPSELSSRSALRMAELAVQAGIPPGVLNVVPGLGQTVGRALGMHMQVDMVTFTGSTQTGKRLMQYAGQSNMKVIVAECGGKSPQIVFDDGVDLDVVAAAVAGMLTTNQGQICSLGSRLLVQQSIESKLLDKIASSVGKVTIGNALDPQTKFGPLASSRQCDTVMGYINSATADGAQVVAGGRRTLLDSRGFFIEPTIVHTTQPQSPIAQQEVFGPVLTVIPFTDEQDAIRLANLTVYGLSAYVWTTRLARGMRVGKAVRSSVIVNSGAALGEGPGHAYSSEPAGQSGIGTEGGMAGLESYMRRQTLWFAHD